MKVEKIRAEVAARPFRPFEIVLDNGDRVPVTHPENVYFLRGEDMYVYANGREWHFEASAVSEVRR